MKWSKQAMRQALFNLIDQGAVRGFDAIITLLLIRILGSAHFGMLSVFQSWVNIIMIVLPAAELILFREYGRMKDSGKLGRFLKAVEHYNIFKLTLAILIVFGLALSESRDTFYSRLSLSSIALFLPLSTALIGYCKETLRLELKQEEVTLISVFQRLVLVVLFSFILYSKTSWFLPIAAVGFFIFMIIFWLVWRSQLLRVLVKTHELKAQALSDSSKILTPMFKSEIIFIHLNGVMFGLIQTLDIFFLNRANTSIETIGKYSIAMKTANLIQIIPIALVSTFGVYLGKKLKSETSERGLLAKLTALVFVISIALGVASYYLSEPILFFIGKGKINLLNIIEIKEQFLWLLAGVLVLSISHPISTYLQARMNLKALFFNVFFPWLVLSTLIYRASSFDSVLITAKMNLLVYLIYFTLLIFNEKLYTKYDLRKQRK